LSNTPKLVNYLLKVQVSGKETKVDASIIKNKIKNISKEKLEDPFLHHYDIFPDNVLIVARHVVVNFNVHNSNEPKKYSM